MPRLALPIAAALSLPFAAPAGAETMSAGSRFELWNDCRAIDLVVESATGGGAGIGLTERAIAARLRARLGAAGLYDPEGLAYLDIRASVVGPAFHVSVEFRKPLRDPASGEEGLAATWISGSTGTHGGDPGYVLASASGLAEGFVEQYLRVNAPACKR